jgi:hypothetical protein
LDSIWFIIVPSEVESFFIQKPQKLVLDRSPGHDHHVCLFVMQRLWCHSFGLSLDYYASWSGSAASELSWRTGSVTFDKLVNCNVYALFPWLGRLPQTPLTYQKLVPLRWER